MGIEPFLVSSSIVLIVAQRLARKICPKCKEEHKASDAALLKIGFPPDQIGKFTCYRGAGCPNCNNTGYRGRIALYEVMPVKEALKELILQGASSLDIKEGGNKSRDGYPSPERHQKSDGWHDHDRRDPQGILRRLIILHFTRFLH